MDSAALLLDVLDAAYDRRSFHGTTLRGSLRGVSVETACWRPAPDRHNIWELLLHAAYWKYRVRRTLSGGPAFQRSPSDWPHVPASPAAVTLRKDIDYLGDEHRLLRAAVESLTRSDLRQPVSKAGMTRAQLVYGVAAHDTHHGGQIQLLKRIWHDLRSPNN